MKKVFIFFALMCAFATHALAVPGLFTEISFSVAIIKNGNGSGNNNPRTPIEPPFVTLDDHLLTLPSNHPSYTLILVDSFDDIAYQITVSENQEEVMLPSTFSGSYELQIIQGEWCFYGDIEL